MPRIVLFLLLPGVQAIPQHVLLLRDGTNTTLPVPSSFTDKLESWRRNVYIVQFTRILLLIFLAIMLHSVYARWRIQKQLPPTVSTQCKLSHDFHM